MILKKLSSQIVHIISTEKNTYKTYITLRKRRNVFITGREAIKLDMKTVNINCASK